MRLGTTTKFRIRYSRIANEPVKVLHKYANWNFFDYYSRTFLKDPKRGPLEQKFYSFVGEP